MTKIEEYQAAKAVADRVTEHYQKAAGLDGPNNDKARIECKLDHMSGQVPILSFHASHGYYGQSGSYTDTDADTAKYVAQAITALGKSVMRKAAELAMADAETARKAAEAEARAVLEQVAQ